jgi:DNA repair exonuclease SbcCD ATPase subunit
LNIIFNWCRWRNFVNTGNNFIEVDFLAARSTLIVGSNGAGKSTLLDAICFGLFNKPFRDCNKPDLVNNMNRKDCLVEIGFQTNGRQYRIVRGIKPSIFEIWQDGELIDQTAAGRDYQEYLESFILKMNFKTFTQIEILGSAAFVPFMRLPAQQRREVIESILDIEIFGVMNQITKTRLKNDQQELLSLEHEISTLVETLVILEKTKTELEKNDAEFINDKLAEIAKIRKLEPRLKELEQEIKLKTHEFDVGLPIIEGLSFELKRFRNSKAAFEGKRTHFLQTVRFFENNDVCSTCQQPITAKHKKSIVGDINIKIENFNKAIQGADKAERKANEAWVVCSETNNKIQKDLENIRLAKANIEFDLKRIPGLEREIEKRKTSKTSVGEVTQQLDDIRSQLKDKSEAHILVEDNVRYLEMIQKLLKDGGIKALIIKRYLPLINKTVNKYLQLLDFYIGFQIDETFNAKIKRRFREDTSYGSMSQGEKMRIDLALLLTWREVAKQKNSISTNLLIMDEIFDGPMDNSGIDEFMKLMGTFESNLNFIVISHKELMQDKFDRVLKFTEVRNFSHMETLDG